MKTEKEGVRVAYALLCDYALNSQDSKTSIIGIFSRIMVPETPAARLQAFLVFGTRAPRNKPLEQFRVRVECVTPKNDFLFAINAAVRPKFVGDSSPLTVAHHIVQLPPLMLPNLGVYEVRIYLNEAKEPSATAPFEVAGIPFVSSEKSE